MFKLLDISFSSYEWLWNMVKISTPLTCLKEEFKLFYFLFSLCIVFITFEPVKSQCKALAKNKTKVIINCYIYTHAHTLHPCRSHCTSCSNPNVRGKSKGNIPQYYLDVISLLKSHFVKQYLTQNTAQHHNIYWTFPIAKRKIEEKTQNILRCLA